MNMASSNLKLLLLEALIVLQHVSPSAGNFLAPLLSPIQDNMCNDMNCGKGSCKASGNLSFPTECDCDAGWSQFLNLKFLPCVIPNCSLDASCMKGNSTVPEKSRAANESIFSPCRWADCGGGSCNRTSLLSYDCVCDEGYYNLMNVTVFPCYKECALGFDCANLGTSSSNDSTTSPSVADDGGNNASSVTQGCSPCLFISILLLGMLQLSYAG